MVENNQVEVNEFIDELLSVIYAVVEIPDDKKEKLRQVIIKLFKLRGKKLFRTMLRIYRYGE